MKDQKKDIKYMKEAVKEARKALKIDEVPVGAVIVHNDEIIGRGHNLKEKMGDPVSHAEIIAIKEAANFLGDWRLLDCELYVTIEPCPMCAGAILQARIKRVIYGADDKKSGAVNSLYNLLNDKRLNHRVEVKKGILAGEIKKIMKTFFKNLRTERT